MTVQLRAPRKRPDESTVRAAITETGGNLTRAAERLGVTRQSLYTWVYQYGLDRFVGIDAPPAEGPKLALVPAPEKRVSRTVAVSPELWRWVRITALERDVSASKVVEDALVAARKA